MTTPSHPVTITSFGTVSKIQFPLVTVTGLRSVINNEIIQFESGVVGQVLSFTEHTCLVMLLDQEPVSLGSGATATGKQLNISLSQNVLGSILSPLGKELLRLNENNSKRVELENQFSIRTIDTPPPALRQRTPITAQLETGVGYVDSLLPLAKGQRELIVGDRQTEKTPFLYQLILNQAKQGAKIVFCMIGKRHQEVAELASFIRENNLEQSTVVVSSNSQDAPSVISLTPLTAMTVAEYFRDQGQEVVLILDDLTTHAKFVREVALIANSFPGRDSYPGSIFYTHAKLLERAGCFLVDNKAVTITAIPVAQTLSNELTDFIVSNLISITDGHLLFDTVLRQRGQHPPINVGLSVTRVGKQTQSAIGRQLSRDLTFFMAKYNALTSLMHFGNELSEEAKATLERGQKIDAFFQQESLTIMPLTTLYVGLYSILSGWWDAISVAEIPSLKQKLVSNYLNNSTFSKQLEAAVGLESFKDFSKTIDAIKSQLEKLR